MPEPSTEPASPEPALSGLLLPPDVRILHLGPHKTGTTAIQYAFHESREAQHAQKVHYAHSGTQAYLPALGLTGRTGRIGGPVATADDWQGLLRELEEYDDYRCVISSESFSHADTETIARLRDDLGPDRVHILRMVRRYDGLLGSQWQQGVADGVARGEFEAWLERVLDVEERSFWFRHHYAEGTKRWLDVVGPDHMSVVVVDTSDRTWLLRVMEALTGLTPGTLPQPSNSNDSMTLQETRAMMLVNRFLDRRGWDHKAHYQYLRLAARSGLRSVERDPHSRKILLPEWARPIVRERSLAHIEMLRETGVRIIGDTGLLEVPEDGPVHDPDDPYFESMPLRSVVAVLTSIGDRAEKGTFPIWTEAPTDPLTVKSTGRRSAEGRQLLDEVRAHAAEHGWDQARTDHLLAALEPVAVTAPRLEVPEGRMPIAQVSRLVATAIEATDPAAPGAVVVPEQERAARPTPAGKSGQPGKSGQSGKAGQPGTPGRAAGAKPQAPQRSLWSRLRGRLTRG